MDTLIILAILASLALCYFFPKRIFGRLLFWAAWAAVILLFLSHVSDPLLLNF